MTALDDDTRRWLHKRASYEARRLRRGAQRRRDMAEGCPDGMARSMLRMADTLDESAERWRLIAQATKAMTKTDQENS